MKILKIWDQGHFTILIEEYPLSFYNFDQRFSIFFGLRRKLRKYIYFKSNQSGNISLQKLTRLKKNCDCTKITGESLPLLPSPWRVRAKMTMIPSLDQREGLATKFWAKLEDPSYFLDRFDMEWAIIVSKNTRYEIPRFVATNTTRHWHLLRGRFHKLHCLL